MDQNPASRARNAACNDMFDAREEKKSAFEKRLGAETAEEAAVARIRREAAVRKGLVAEAEAEADMWAAIAEEDLWRTEMEMWTVRVWAVEKKAAKLRDIAAARAEEAKDAAARLEQAVAVAAAATGEEALKWEKEIDKLDAMVADMEWEAAYRKEVAVAWEVHAALLKAAPPDSV